MAPRAGAIPEAVSLPPRARGQVGMSCPWLGQGSDSSKSPQESPGASAGSGSLGGFPGAPVPPLCQTGVGGRELRGAGGLPPSTPGLHGLWV